MAEKSRGKRREKKEKKKKEEEEKKEFEKEVEGEKGRRRGVVCQPGVPMARAHKVVRRTSWLRKWWCLGATVGQKNDHLRHPL